MTTGSKSRASRRSHPRHTGSQSSDGAAHSSASATPTAPVTTGSDRGLDQERLDVMRDKARVDTAWEIQKALLDWNGRVDIRATFTLTIDTALIGAVIALSTDGGLFAGLGGASRVFNFVGVAFVFASALCAVAVVTPVLRRRSVLQSEARNHNKFIYYGHLRQLSDTEIHRYLELDGPAILGALSHELKYTGDNAWRKNRFTQLALLFTTVVGASLSQLSDDTMGVCSCSRSDGVLRLRLASGASGPYRRPQTVLTRARAHSSAKKPGNPVGEIRALAVGSRIAVWPVPRRGSRS